MVAPAAKPKIDALHRRLYDGRTRMDSRTNPPKPIKDIFAELLAGYESAGKNSHTILHLFRDEHGKPSGYQIERKRREMVEISLN